MRLTELFTLRWENVNLAQAVAIIPRTKHGEWRDVRLNSEAVDLRGLPSRLKSEWVFPSRNDTPADGHNFVNQIFIPAVREARIQNFRFHDLRHTFCSRLAMKGVPLNTIRELAGHKTIRMTERYSHLSPNHLAEAVELLSTNLNRTTIGPNKNASRRRR